MFKKWNELLTSLFNPDEVNQPKPTSLALACSVLLCEVMRADHDNSVAEELKLKALIGKQFPLTEDEINSTIDTALQLSENATDFYQFTHAINHHYSLEQRINIVNLLWQVAYADGNLASIEEHIIRKIADLLHLRHSEYIATKINAKTMLSNR